MTLTVMSLEDHKDQQFLDVKFRGEARTFDQAVFAVSEYHLHDAIKRALKQPHLSKHTDVFRAWQDFCVSQIRQVVDVALFAYFSSPGPVYVTSNTVKRVASAKHDLLQPRAKALVRSALNERSRKAIRKHSSQVCGIVEAKMNSVNWDRLALAFCQSYQPQ